jgi:hypothetical protein
VIVAAIATTLCIGGWLAIRLSEESEKQKCLIATIMSTKLDDNE